MTDVLSSYEQGLKALLEQLGKEHPHYSEALTFQSRLLENIDQTERWGDTEIRRAERAQLVHVLNQVSLNSVGLSFNEICSNIEKGTTLASAHENDSTLHPNRRQTRPFARFHFDHLIETHTRLFAGRGASLQAIHDFIRSRLSGYVFVEAFSGYGKTLLLARIVQDNPCFAYHFISQVYKNQWSDFDPTEMQTLLLNLCEQLDAEVCQPTTSHDLKARFHGLLRTSPVSGQRVVIIDAVDEVSRHPNYLRGLFPITLPPGVFVIFSARKLGDRTYLPEIGLQRDDIGLLVELSGLDESAIAQLLDQAGGKASPLARVPVFVSQLHQVSNGDPFYLRFLIEDVASGRITSDNVDCTPCGLNEYLDLQLSILDHSIHLPQQRDILGLILAAYGPLSRRDLINIVEGLNGFNFDNVIRDIQRFLLVYNDTYTFCHDRFKQYFGSKVL